MDNIIREILHYFISPENNISPALKIILHYFLYILIICFCFSNSIKLLDLAFNTKFFQSLRLSFIKGIDEMWSDAPFAIPSKKDSNPYWILTGNFLYLIDLILIIFIACISALIYIFQMDKMEHALLWHLFLFFVLVPCYTLLIRKCVNEIKILIKMKFML